MQKLPKLFFALFLAVNFFIPAHVFAEPPKVYSIIFPSTNPLSAKYDKAIHNGESALRKAGYDKNDISAINAALLQKDEAWHTADVILKGIQTGAIDSNNIAKYSTEEFKSPRILKKIAMSFFLQKIKSLGDKTTLSTNYTKGIEPDFMVIEKKFGQQAVKITVVKKIKSENEMIRLTFSASYPYKNWLLAGVYMTKTYTTKAVSK